MAEYLIQDTTLDAIADAINAKTGGSSAMTPAQMVTAIGNIQTGSGTDISPFKFVKGTMTPAADTHSLVFPCGDITTVVFLEARVVNYADYISTENNYMGLGVICANFRPYFNNNTFAALLSGAALAVYNGAFDRWQLNKLPTINTTDKTATYLVPSEVTFKSGIAIEYMMWGL